MREIKFRQPLRNSDGSFKEWFYWGFIDDTFISPAMQLNAIDTRKESQEYTGLNDRNGKEIYEGDVLRHDSMYILKFHETGQVVYEPDCGGFIVNGKWSKNQHHETLNCDIAEICEIIGNIHEHANLLATGKG